MVAEVCCMDSSFRAMDHHLHPIWELPAWKCHGINPRHGLSPWPQRHLLPWDGCGVESLAALSLRHLSLGAGDASPKEGPEVGGHRQWAGGEPGPWPTPSNLLQDEHYQEASVPCGSSLCWVAYRHLSNGEGFCPTGAFQCFTYLRGQVSSLPFDAQELSPVLRAGRDLRKH